MSTIELLSKENEGVTRLALVNALKEITGDEPITDWRRGYIYLDTHSISDQIPIDITTTRNLEEYASIVVPCQAGDTFTCCAHGGAGVAVWRAYLDADNITITRGTANYNFKGTFTVPDTEGIAKMVINTKREQGDFYLVKNSHRTNDMIAPVEDDYTASQNYAVGSYLIVENTLYKVTTAIARNGTIEPGTNCTETTIMAEIAALS